MVPGHSFSHVSVAVKGVRVGVGVRVSKIEVVDENIVKLQSGIGVTSL